MNNFLKGSSQGTSLWHYFKIGPAVPEEKIFKEMLKKLHFITMATRDFDGIKFCGQILKKTPKEHSCQVWSKLALQFGKRRCLKKLLMNYDGNRHRVILKAPLEHVVLWWAKKGLNISAKIYQSISAGTDYTGWSGPTFLLFANFLCYKGQ